MTKLDNIIWEIEPEESRTRNGKMAKITVITLLWTLACILFDMIFRLGSSGYLFSQVFIYVLRLFLFLSLFIVIPGGLYYYFNNKYDYARRSYSLDAEGFEITVDGKRERYAWNEFVSFYTYSRRLSLKYFRLNEAKVVGPIFHLRKKVRSIKPFVIIQAEPNLGSEVYGFILTHLKEEV